MPGDHVPAACGVGTLRAAVRLLPRVGPLVGVKVVGPAEHLPAVQALVGFESRVETHVACEHVRSRKRTVTHFAVMYLVVISRADDLSGKVLRHVFSKVVVGGEYLATHGALVGDVRVREGPLGEVLPFDVRYGF